MFRYQKLCGNGVKSSGKCVKRHEKRHQSEKHTFRHPICWNRHKIGHDNTYSVNNVWSSMWKCVKLYALNSPAWVHTFRHPICWNWDKINKNTKLCDNCIKMCENIMKVCESSWMKLWMGVKVSSLISLAKTHTFRHQTCWNWAKIAQIAWKLCENVWKCVNECVKTWIYVQIPISAILTKNWVVCLENKKNMSKIFLQSFTKP